MTGPASGIDLPIVLLMGVVHGQPGLDRAEDPVTAVRNRSSTWAKPSTLSRLTDAYDRGVPHPGQTCWPSVSAPRCRTLSVDLLHAAVVITAPPARPRT